MRIYPIIYNHSNQYPLLITLLLHLYFLLSLAIKSLLTNVTIMQYHY